jgi:predicted lipoprotein with Yx(FWY)xxD motif
MFASDMRRTLCNNALQRDSIKAASMRKQFVLVGSLTTALTLAACGGGSSGSSATPAVVATATPGPISSPTAPPASTPAPLSTATLLGSSGFVNGSGFTVYVFDADLAQANASSCNGNCAGVWPAVSPPNGTLPSGWTSFQRQDGSMQLAYKGRALYTYVGDPAPGNTNGDGLTEFGGVWHIARP